MASVGRGHGEGQENKKQRREQFFLLFGVLRSFERQLSHLIPFVSYQTTHPFYLLSYQSILSIMPGILMNSLSAARRSSIKNSSSGASLFPSKGSPNQGQSSSSFPSLFARSSSCYSSSNSSSSSTPSTASNSAQSSPGCSGIRLNHRQQPPQHNYFGGAAGELRPQQQRQYSTDAGSAATAASTPPRRIKTSSACLWGKEIPSERGEKWGHFVDCDPYYSD